jgi:hypothetical protein
MRTPLRTRNTSKANFRNLRVNSRAFRGHGARPSRQTRTSAGTDEVLYPMTHELKRLSLDHPWIDEPGLLADAVSRLLGPQRIRFERLWAYYRNPTRASDILDPATSDRPYRQAQEWGLPPRITGAVAGSGVFESTPVNDIDRKEVVIENDIGWRVDMMVDFLFGRPVVINSAAPDRDRARQIETILRNILASNGGLAFLQQLALLGAVYGSVDVLVKYVPDIACATQLLGDNASANHFDLKPRPDLSGALPSVPASASATRDESSPPDSGQDASETDHASALQRMARMIRFEIVEPTRALPLLDPADCRCASAFATVYQVERPVKQSDRYRWLKQWSLKKPDMRRLTIVELISADKWQKYEDQTLVDEGDNSLGRLPLVHIQNAADPLAYDGPSDVEPLMPLQDELNTRLSDRANRITLTAFRMYLGKGIDNFTDTPVAPGQMWSTDNPDAEVIEFGGTDSSPSEESHIDAVREALDKLSGTSPIAAGAIKGRIGRLTSAAALRVTMLALLSRTERKRTTYGLAVAQLCELALAWLDAAGVFATKPEERAIHIHWSNPIPANETERLDEAKARIAIGVPREIVLRELGYAENVSNPITDK